MDPNAFPPDQPLIRFDAPACRDWLLRGAAEEAGIDESLNAENLTIVSGLEGLLRLLQDDPHQRFWLTAPQVRGVHVWRTADGDGIDGGAIVTVDLTYRGEQIRLASLYQSHDKFTGSPATNGIAAAVQALGHVAATVNGDRARWQRATADERTAQGNMYTVVGVWIADEPVPVGVIAGRHEVRGGDEYEHFPQGLWATSVIADDDLDAQQAAIADMLDNQFGAADAEDALDDHESGRRVRQRPGTD